MQQTECLEKINSNAETITHTISENIWIYSVGGLTNLYFTEKKDYYDS